MSQLARRSDAPARDPITEALSVYKPEQYNILTPVSAIDRIPDEMRVRVAIVKVNTDNETYPLPGGGGKRALNKTALDKIASALGIRWVQSYQSDDWNDPHRIRFTAEGNFMDFDGMVKNVIKSKSIDLRGERNWKEDDCGDDTKEYLRQARASEKKNAEKFKREYSEDRAMDSAWDRILSARRHIVALAESGACNRVIRSAAAIASAFKPEDLNRPFVIPALVPDPDMSDPMTRQMVNAQRLGITGMLFGNQRNQPTQERHVIQGEVEHSPALPNGQPDPDPGGMDDAPDPWDAPEESQPAQSEDPDPAICFFPLETEILNSLTGDRFKYCNQVTWYANKVLMAHGHEKGYLLLKKHGGGIDPETASLEEIAAFGKSLKELLT